MATKVILEIEVRDDDLALLKSELDGIGASVKVVEQGSENVEKGFKKIGKSSYIFQELNKMTGGLAGKVVDVYNGLAKMNITLNATKAALIATGIGAFVVLLGTVIAYWDDIRDAIFGANREMEAQVQLTKDLNKELELRNQLEQDNKRFVDVQTKERLLRAKIAGASEEELTQIQREGLQNRIIDLEQYAKDTTEILRKSTDETYDDALKAQIKAAKDLGEARSALANFDLEQQLPDKDKKTGSGRRKRESKVNPLTGEDMDSEMERIQEHFAALFDLDILQKEQLQDAADAANEEFLNSEEASQAKIFAAKQKYKELSDQLVEAEKEAKLAALDAVGLALAQASVLAGRHTAAGKALAISATLIDTYVSAIAAYKGMIQAIPGPVGIVAGAVAAAGSIAFGLAQVKQIASIKVPGGGGASGGASPSSPPTFNVVGASPQNQLNQALLENKTEPVQAFVVEGEVTTAESMRRNKIEASSL